MTPSTSLFVLNALNLDRSCEPEPLLRQGLSLYFSDMDEAENAVSRYQEAYHFLYDSQDASMELYCLLLDEYELDCMYPKKLSTRVYSPQGLLKEQMKVCEEGSVYGESMIVTAFLEGDLVEAPVGELLRLGIVLQTPNKKDDDHYKILFYPDMEEDYIYAPLVFEPSRPVSKRISFALRQAWTAYKEEAASTF